MKLRHICFLVPGYPSEDEPVYTFVKQLIDAIANHGIRCTVIVTQSITKQIIRGRSKRPLYWEDTTKSGKIIEIYQPKTISISKVRIFNRNISAYITKKVIETSFDKIRIKPDIIYAHFWHYGVTAGAIGRKHNIPVFVATGESKIWVDSLFRRKDIEKNLGQVKGVISVSNKNKIESIELGLATDDKIKVIPNAIDRNKFYRINKEEARRKLGYDKDAFIVAYTGAFTHRKGILRVSDAVKSLNDVYTIYIGKGDLKPDNEGILFQGSLPHEEIVNYLNAADVFVLPTLAEGCPNAIIEAMGCGLPIISSDLPFNDEILDEKNSIRIDPNNVDEISAAIKYLKDNPEVRNKMGEESYEKAKNLDIDSRAKKIIDFIEQSLEQEQQV